MPRRRSHATPGLPRGVYEQPPDDRGNRVFIALTSKGTLAGVELVPPGEDTKPAITALWDQLDAVDRITPGVASFPAVRLTY